MNIVQKRTFKQVYKKLHPEQKYIVDCEVKKLLENPEIGIQKKQDLRGVYVHKFYITNTLYLLAYTFDPVTLRLILLGGHENFYKNLKIAIK